MCETVATNCNYIIDTVIKIDKIQKEIHTEDFNCVSCESSLITRAYNTIPVSFETCCGNQFTANLDLVGDTTIFFRVESVRDRRFVTLRLLETRKCESEHELIGTKYTCILDLNCVCLMQCYEAINVSCCD